MSTENIADQEKALLAHVPEDGSAVGNVKLIRTLGWQDAQYWELRDKLLEKGILTTGRGRGGSVRRILTETAPLETGIVPSTDASGAALIDAQQKIAQLSESSLYKPIADVLGENWTKDKSP
jgi:hypothetical protein